MSGYGEKLNDYDIRLDNEHMTLNLLWLREVAASSESLLSSPLCHRFHELQYVLDGFIEIRLYDRALRLEKGQLYLLTPGTLHETIGYSENTRKLVLAFDGEFTDDELRRRMEAVSGTLVKETDVLRELAALLIKTGASGGRFAQTEIQCLAEAFFFELAGIASLPSRSDDSSGLGKKGCSAQEKAGRVVEYIRENTRRKSDETALTVTELAERFFISRRHLNRLCSTATGKTARQLIDSEKLRYICEMLTSTNFTLLEIASMTGFSSEYSLVRFFKANEGYTPGQYRKYTTE